MRIFWNYKKAFMGLPLVAPIMQKAVIVPAALVTTLYVSQYLLTSSVYYDEYDGNVSEGISKK